MPWRDLPDQFGAWQTVHRRFKTWSDDGTLDRVLAELLVDADADGQLRWDVSVDSTVARVHQHGATAARCSERAHRRTQGAISNDKNPQVRRDEPGDHGIGRSRGGLTTKAHALVDGHGRLLALICTPG